jgi:NAD(P)-dependent dehydrogenase (short-subunit alcohol dehydrogenase family)
MQTDLRASGDAGAAPGSIAGGSTASAPGAGRSILVTGAASGIGRHAIGGLKERGWRVFAGARSKEDVKRLGEEGFEAIHFDYDSPAIISTALYRILDKTGGRLDAVFNNGAYSQLGAVEDLGTEYLRAQFETNFFGWHELIRRVVPVMRRQGHGRIVNCSSILGFVSTRYRGAYAASKFAIEGLTDTLRLELADTNIKVVLIQPGPISSGLSGKAVERFKETIDIDHSPHRDAYRRALARLKDGEFSTRFRLGPEAVFAKLVMALENPRPRARYRVTVLTEATAVAKRLLPTSLMDRILLRQR